MLLRCSLLVLLLALAPLAKAEDLKSGPPEGEAPELKVFDTTGPNTGNEVDYVADRKGKPTVYAFIAADKWDRPVARYLKVLDTALAKTSDDAYLVAVWLTEDVEKTKAYLPKAQQSLMFSRAALTCYTGDKSGPEKWMIDSGAHLTAVVTVDGKVVKSFAYRSLNETDVPAVREALEKAIKK
jgi:hypothetical protein